MAVGVWGGGELWRGTRQTFELVGREGEMTRVVIYQMFHGGRTVQGWTLRDKSREIWDTQEYFGRHQTQEIKARNEQLKWRCGNNRAKTNMTFSACNYVIF